MSTLPAGTVTFLFTDIEGSTKLAQALGDARWASCLQEHRHLLRQAFGAHAGREVDTQGDSFFVAFAKATDAVAAAIAAQQALDEHAWPDSARIRVRLGLHTGEAVIDGDHYIGQEVHKASRICDAGHGGQIVLSQMTADLLRDSLPSGTELTDLGHHRLKDMGDAQRLFQLDVPGLSSDFPRLRSLDLPHNLPAERSSFIGREKEIEAIRGSLGRHRLVMLTGIGGSGKTRLALQVGARELAGFPDGVFFVDLAPVGDPDLVSPTTATACGLAVGEGGGGSPDDQLASALARRKCLLLIDNCEHLLDAVADLVDRVLADCPGVKVLATSREALGVEGEQIVQVASLGVPEDPSEAEASEAVRLFVERAKSVKPAFELGRETRGAVVEICRRLDGIPLAIEFAAARVAHLSPQQIADRLKDVFRLLTSGRRRIQRQQTLAAALDWSHELLNEEERTLFRRLAVFVGGFSLEAAEAVCAADGITTGAVLDLLGSLVAKSLITSADDAGEVRYRLLETVRMYAEEKLAATGEAETMRSRHRDWYLGWVEGVPLERLTFTLSGRAALARENDNLRAAADWCEANDRPDLLARLATRMYAFGMDSRSASQDGRRRLVSALRHADRLSADERVACHAAQGQAAWSALETELPLAEATRAIDLAAGRPSPFLVVALTTRSFANSVLAAFPGAAPQLAADARRDVEQAVAVAGTELPAEWRAYAEFNGWMIEVNMGNPRAAVAWCNSCMETCRAAEEPGWLGVTALVGLAVSYHLLGETDQALQAALQFRASGGLQVWRATLSAMAIDVTPALAAGGKEEIAAEVLREATQTVRRLGTPLAENHLLSMFAYVEHLRGRPHRASRLLGATRHLGGAAGLQIPFRTPASWALYRHYLPLVRAALEPDEARRARDEGRAMSLDEALTYALEGLD